MCLTYFISKFLKSAIETAATYSNIAIFEAEGTDYIALLPMDEDGESDDGQVYLYRFIDNGEDEEPGLENIEDDDEFERASEAFNDWMESQDFGDIDLDDIE